MTFYFLDVVQNVLGYVLCKTKSLQLHKIYFSLQNLASINDISTNTEHIDRTCFVYTEDEISHQCLVVVEIYLELFFKLC